MVEEQVSQLLLQNNKPFNVQTITDCLAQFGIKKGQVQKAVDALSAEGGSIACKEFGKTKIYFPKQSHADAVSPEDMEAKKALQAQLTEQMTERATAVKALKTELQALRDCMSLAEVERRTRELQAEVEAGEQKLMLLQTGTELISEEERQQVEKKFSDYMGHWQKRRKIFKCLWSAVSEFIEGKKADIFEEIGVEGEDEIEWKQLSEQLRMPSKRQRK